MKKGMLKAVFYSTIVLIIQKVEKFMKDKKMKIIIKIIIAVIALFGTYKLGTLNINTNISVNPQKYQVQAQSAVVNNGEIKVYVLVKDTLTGDVVTIATQSNLYFPEKKKP